jgi:hypothetical protein
MELIQKAIDADILKVPGPFVGERAPRVFMSREQYDQWVAARATSEVNFYSSRDDEKWYCGHAFECENGEVMLILHRDSTLPRIFGGDEHYIAPLHPFTLGARCLCHGFSIHDYVRTSIVGPSPSAVPQN